MPFACIFPLVEGSLVTLVSWAVGALMMWGVAGMTLLPLSPLPTRGLTGMTPSITCWKTTQLAEGLMLSGHLEQARSTWAQALNRIGLCSCQTLWPSAAQPAAKCEPSPQLIARITCILSERVTCKGALWQCQYCWVVLP